MHVLSIIKTELSVENINPSRRRGKQNDTGKNEVDSEGYWKEHSVLPEKANISAGIGSGKNVPQWTL